MPSIQCRESAAFHFLGPSAILLFSPSIAPSCGFPMPKKAKNSKYKIWHKITWASQDGATAGIGQERCLPCAPPSTGGNRKKRGWGSQVCGNLLRTNPSKLGTPGAAAEDTGQPEEGEDTHVVPVKSSQSSCPPKHRQRGEGEERH